MIRTTPFYKTNAPEQSKFYWGNRALQTGQEFNPANWNAVPEAPATPWGSQQIAQPLSYQQIQGMFNGQMPQQQTVAPATRINYGQPTFNQFTFNPTANQGTTPVNTFNPGIVAGPVAPTNIGGNVEQYDEYGNPINGFNPY